MRVHQVQRYSGRLRFVAILIPTLFILGLATIFIGTKLFYKDVSKYVYGVAVLLVYGSIFLSFVNLIILTTKPNIGLKNKLVWSLITAIPIIGFGLMLLFLED